MTSGSFLTPRAAAGDDGDNLLTNLISFWEMEEASGTRVDAVVASGNDLTDNATVTQNPGKVGNAAQFTLANSEWLSHVSNASLQFGDIDYTFTAWVYLDTKPEATNQNIMGKNNGTAEQWLFYNNDAGEDRFRFVIYNGVGTVVADQTASAFGSPSTATWYFAVGWFDSVGGNIFISINNGTVNSSAKTGTPGTNSVTFGVGAKDAAATPFSGRIDQVAIWKRVLTAAERTWLYNSGNGRAFSELGP